MAGSEQALELEGLWGSSYSCTARDFHRKLPNGLQRVQDAIKVQSKLDTQRIRVCQNSKTK